MQMVPKRPKKIMRKEKGYEGIAISYIFLCLQKYFRSLFLILSEQNNFFFIM